MSNTEVRIVNEQGEDVAQNGIEIGEIIVKGDGVANNEEVTNRSVKDGWMHTGDMGTIDESGSIKVVDQKNNDNRKGISTADIEIELSKHPAVQEIAAILTPHKELGETSHAVVVLHDGNEVSEQDLLDYSMEKLPSANIPNTITFVDELPKTISGKILKIQLREMV
ncbi:class I adenylate-forming enzyme family protein [Virgibacillus profundi]|nr:AMP-binding protein [Virgibacillus profundi]